VNLQKLEKKFMTTHSIRAAALSTGNDFHLLDHIAPLADLLQIPLITTEEKNFKLAQNYYPHVQVEYDTDLEFKLASLAERFEALFECKYWIPQLKTLFRGIHNKEMQLIFCPHGQSDKGRGAPLLAPYAEQDAVLIYGDLLIEMLKELDVWPAISKYAMIGNYRLFHYLHYKQFYDALAEKEFFSRLPKQRTLLYAPTWQDADQSTSFFQGIPKLFSELPSDWNLIVKAHPRLEEKDPARFYFLSQLAVKRKNSLIITEFPPVYPLLAKADVFLGDFSSVGYDFLFFQRPMFFFSHPSVPSGRLQTCGQILPPDVSIFPFIEQNIHSDFTKKQKELYELAFGKDLSQEIVRESILKLLQ